jgi:uncharacterized protein YndB with AHSA1/START domain
LYYKSRLSTSTADYVMTRINREITIQAPVGTVFGFIAKPSNLQRVWPSLVEISNEESLPDGGYSFNWRYDMGGVSLVGSGQHADIATNQWIVAKMNGSIDCTMTWAFRNLGRATKLFMTIDYQIPIPVLGWLAGKTILKMNEQEADTMLSNIQTSCERGRGPMAVSIRTIDSI